jgi:hypothetical protein
MAGISIERPGRAVDRPGDPAVDRADAVDHAQMQPDRLGPVVGHADDVVRLAWIGHLQLVEAELPGPDTG